jgi:ribosomal protein L11 methyltransferase
LLDVGCGTGILSIAVAHLGVAEVLGIDHDPDAVRLARDNADANGVTAACRFEDTPVGDLPGTWPLVVANILAHILEALADDIAARVAPGGRLLLSGALVSQADSLQARYVAAGLTPVARAVSGEWARLELMRP